MHPSRLIRAAAAALVLLAGAGPTAADTRDRLEAFLARVQTLRADFHQQLFDETGRPIEASRGTFYLSRPDRFRWSYTEPYRQEIVADGERVWLYDSELDQVTVKELGEALGGSPARLLSSGAPVGEDFEVSELGAQDGLQWVRLIPRDPETTFTALRLAFAGDTLRRMELEDGFGQTTRLDFTAVEENPTLDAGVFHFTPPPGVDVIREGH